MKKTFTLLLCTCLLCTSLAGCDNSKADPIGDTITHYTTEGKVTKLVGGESLTGELKVQLLDSAYSKADLTRAESLYKKLYPNVRLTMLPNPLHDATKDNISEEYSRVYSQLQTEIMAGGGPDVFSVGSGLVDTYKVMEAGAYADLTSYFENDENFNVSDFAENVLYSGQQDGKQYVIPIGFNRPLIFTTQEIIDVTGFNLKKCTDLMKTEEEMLRCLKENKLGCIPKMETSGWFMPYLFLIQGDNQWFNYKQDEVNLVGNENIRKTFEVLKGLAPYIPVDPETGSFGGISLDATEAFHDQSTMFTQIEVDFDEKFLIPYRALKEQGDSPTFFTVKNTQGQNQAYSYNAVGVGSTSKNIPAAYAFIKMLISPEFNIIENQEKGIHSPFVSSSFPLNKDIFRKHLTEQGTRESTLFTATDDFIKMATLSQEEIDSMIESFYSVDCSRFDIQVIYDIMENMRPYIFKDADYDSCMKDAQNFAEIYVSE